MVDISYEETDGLNFSSSEVEAWLVSVCALESKALDEVSIIFCSDNYLLEINQQHLNHDYYTDIITFDYCVDSYISGDLFISVDRVSENALMYGVPFINEIYRVIVHGILHLIGFSDKSNDEEMIMRKKEDEALSMLGFT